MSGFPGHVGVSVEDHILHVVISEEIVPDGAIGTERLVEDKEHVGVVTMNDFSRTSVVIEQDVQIGMFPRLIDWLEGVESGMLTEDHHELVHACNCPVDILRLKVIVLQSVCVKVPNPIASLNRPVFEMCLINPFNIGHLATVIKSVLAPSDSVHI